MGAVRRVIGDGLGRTLRLIPLTFFMRTVTKVVLLRLRDEPAAEALRAIFRMDATLYGLSGQKAVELDGGAHAKHRLTGYVYHFARLAAEGGGPVLDVGCGDGDLADRIAAMLPGRQVVGIDSEKKRIAAAAARHSRPNLRFVHADATRTEVSGGPFVTIVLSNVLEHVVDRPGLLRRLVRLYRPSTIILRVPDFERDWRVPLKRELGVEWRLDSTHEIEHREEELRLELAAADLEVVNLKKRWGEIWAVARPVISGVSAGPSPDPDGSSGENADRLDRDA